MHWLDKLLIFLAALVLVVIGVSVLLTGLGINLTETVLSVYKMFLGPNMVYGLVIGGLLTLIGFYLAGRWLGYSREDNDLISVESELGRIRISEQVIKAYVEKAAISVDGIKDVNTKVINQEDGLHIFIEATTKADVKTSDMAKVVQKRVAEFVEDTVGTKVAKVEIHVAKVDAQPKSRLN